MLALIYTQEREAGRTKDPWCISTLKRLKDVSPLSLKVSLRSVSSCHVSEATLNLNCYTYELTRCYQLTQIREGRYQTLDQCLVREYRMSLQGSYKQISGDFCEVWYSLTLLNQINFLVFLTICWLVSSSGGSGATSRKGLSTKGIIFYH